jgi:hypothetical protein
VRQEELAPSKPAEHSTAQGEVGSLAVFEVSSDDRQNQDRRLEEKAETRAPTMPIEHPLHERTRPAPNSLAGLERIVRKHVERMGLQAAGGDIQPLDRSPDLRPTQRIERSAWHSIVVDAHGREVAGAITYGESFNRERQQEIVTEPVAEDDENNSIATVAPQPQAITSSPPSDLPSGLTTPTLPTGLPPQQPRLTASNKHYGPGVNSTWFWVILTLIIAVLITVLLV